MHKRLTQIFVLIIAVGLLVGCGSHRLNNSLPAAPQLSQAPRATVPIVVKFKSYERVLSMTANNAFKKYGLKPVKDGAPLSVTIRYGYSEYVSPSVLLFIASATVLPMLENSYRTIIAEVRVDDELLDTFTYTSDIATLTTFYSPFGLFLPGAEERGNERPGRVVKDKGYKLIFENIAYDIAKKYRLENIQRTEI